jgi:glucose-1-phosphate adenylyltransferase
MLQAHLDKRAALTVGCIIVERKDAGQLGIAVVNADHRVQAFVEKPKENPPTLPGDSGRCLASMGIYVFETEELVRRVSRDARRESAHDFGKNIIPEMVQEQAAVYAYPFKEDNLNQPAYWRDVGTLDGYYEANMELVRPVPPFNLYDTAWPIRTYLEPMPPAKFVHNEMGAGGRRGRAHESLVPQGVIISGGLVERSVLSPGVRVNSFAHVEDSILMEGVVVGRRARLRKCIIDKGVVIPEGATVGFDPKSDAKRFAVSGGGITIIPKEMPV